ncbi:MAG: CPBP family intramembrane glutamic endopeptidase [Sphingomicrobium sp.]
MNQPRAKIALFLALTIIFSMVVWWPLAAGRPPLLGGQLDALALMWSPGLAAIVTRLVTQGNVRGMGWIPKSPPMLGLALILPLLYAGPVYLIAWNSGLGGFDPAAWAAPGQAAVAGLAAMVGFGLLTGLVAATGEEIGWRGLLVPELAKRMNFRALVIVSGLIWAAWHIPVMWLAGYSGQGTPFAYSLTCFVLMIVALGGVMAWMTLKTRSFWPAALLHATHNLFVQTVFDSATEARANTAWWTGEFGIGLVITLWLTLALLVRFGGRIEGEKRT